MKAELDPSESLKPTTTSLTLKVLGVGFVLFCVVAAGAMIWGAFPVRVEGLIKIAASFVLVAIGVIAVMSLFYKKSA